MSLVKVEFQGVEAGNLKLDAGFIEVPPEQVDKVKGLIQNIYDAAKAVREAEAECERKDGEIDALKESMTSPENLDKLVAERTAVLSVAEVNGLKRDDIKSMSIPEIKRAVVAKVSPNIKTDASDDYIQGRYDVILDQAVKTAANKQKLNRLGGATAGRADAKGSADDVNDGEKTYREIAEAKLAGLHDKTDEEITKSGLN